MDGSAAVNNRGVSRTPRKWPPPRGRQASSSSTPPAATSPTRKPGSTPSRGNQNGIPTKPVGLPIPDVGRNTPEIDRGAAGSVHKYDAPDGRKYVIKQFHDHNERTLFEFFRNHEFRAASHFLGENVRNMAAIVGIDPTRNLLMFERVPGVNLGKFINQGYRDGMPPQLAARIVGKVAEALTHIKNKGFIHRDIKPGNIMVYEKNGKIFVNIIDLGIALPTSEGTTNTTVAGTARYMSPEQAKGEALTPKTDCWSLGVTLYKMLTGKNLGKNRQEVLEAQKNPTEYIRQVPAEFQLLLASMLSPDPRLRITSEGISSECGKILEKVGLPPLTGNNHSTKTPPSSKTSPGTSALPEATSGTRKVAGNGTWVMRDGRVVTPDGTVVILAAEANKPKPKLTEIPELARTVKGKTAIEKPYLDSKVRDILKKHGYTTDAEINKAMAELRLKRLAATFFTSHSTAGGFKSGVADILRTKTGALGTMSAADFAKLIESIKLSSLSSFRKKIDQLMDQQFKPLKDLGFTKAEILNIGTEVIKVDQKYVERTASVADRARRVMAGEIDLSQAEYAKLVLTLKTLADPAKTSAANLRKMGLERQTAKDLAEALEKRRTTKVEDRPPTTEEADLIRKINKLARKAGLKSVISKKSLAKLLEVLEDPKQMEKLSKRLQEKLNPQKLAKLLRKLVREGKIDPAKAAELLEVANKLEQKRVRGEVGKQIFKQQAAGLLVGLVTLIGAEELAKAIGIENEHLRFAFVLGLAHVGNTATLSIYKSGLKASCQELLTSFTDVTKALTTIATRTKLPRLKRARITLRILNKKVGLPAMKFGVGLVSSLAMFSVVGRSYDHILAKYFDVSADSALRSELGNMVATFVIPAGASTVSQYTKLLLEHRYKAIVAQAGEAAAARSVAGRLLGGLRFAGGALPYVFVAIEGINLMSSAFITDYEANINKRIYDSLIEKGIYDPSVGGEVLEATVTSLQINRVLLDHVKPLNRSNPIISNILDQDRKISDSVQNDLAFLCATLIMRDVQNGTQKAAQTLSNTFSPVTWGKITVQKSEPVNGSPSRLIGQGGAPVAPQPGQMGMDSTFDDLHISEEDIFNFVMGYCSANQRDLGDQEVLKAAAQKFDLTSNQYHALLPKFRKAALQQQIANLYTMDPDRYGILPGEVIANGKNDAIRAMFNDKGKLKPGQERALMQWALKKNVFKVILKSIRSSSKQIMAKGTEEAKLQHKLGIARLRCEYLKPTTSGIRKTVIGQILKAMGDATDQQKYDEIKVLVEDFDALAKKKTLSKDQLAARLMLLTSQLDELIKLA